MTRDGSDKSEATSPSRAQASPGSRRSLSVPKKVLFSLLVCASFFALMELALTVAGVRQLLYEEDPYVGFTSQVPLYVEQPGTDGEMKTAANKLSYFNAQHFSRRKPPGTYRIFCVGGVDDLRPSL